MNRVVSGVLLEGEPRSRNQDRQDLEIVATSRRVGQLVGYFPVNRKW